MSDPKHLKPPGNPPPAGTVAPPGAQTRPSQGRGEGPGGPGGKVVHDQRGNAVWDWLKDTGRNAIESTSRLLRRLEAPGLKMEDKKDEELRLMDDEAGGGYDPYNQRQTSRRPRK